MNHEERYKLENMVFDCRMSIVSISHGFGHKSNADSGFDSFFFIEFNEKRIVCYE